jgi:hypothetical protein
MKNFAIVAVLFLLVSGFSATRSFAGPPFNDLEGVGGVAFNPLAWLADSSGDNSHLKSGDTDILGKPRFGSWYVNLNQNQPNIDWTSLGLAESLFDRVEVSYGYEAVALKQADTFYKHNLGAKLNLVPEDGYGVTGLPAVSAGLVYKSTTYPVGKSWTQTGEDYYAVVTKLIGGIPTPILLSAGAVDTDSVLTGVLGFDSQTKVTFFGNIDVILPENIVVGFEYKQSPQYSDWKDSDYWDAHLAWIANSNLTVIAAFVDTGSPLQDDTGAGDIQGLGNGVVLSSQYAL